MSHICCNSMFQIFQLFQSYVAASDFMLQVTIFGCFMCFTHMLQMHIPNVYLYFRHMLHSNIFYVASVLCCSAGDGAGGQLDGASGTLGGVADGGTWGGRTGAPIGGAPSLVSGVLPRGERGACLDNDWRTQIRG